MIVRISEVTFSAAGPGDRETGLLGFVAATLNDALRLDGMTLRRTRDGRLVLSFPAKGGRHPYFRPLTDYVRREIQRQIFEAIGRAVH